MFYRTACLLLVASILQADALSDLKALLGRLNGQEPIKVNVDYQFWKKNGDPKKPVITQGKASAKVEDGPQGLQISWNRALVQAASQEARARVKNPETPTPTREAINDLNAVELHGYLNGADDLLRTLEQAQLIDQKSETWEGKPARVLYLTLVPAMAASQRKYVKELNATAKVWLGPDGLPLAAESSIHVKGRALLVISFETNNKHIYQFGRSGNRLLVLRHTEESSGSGGGEIGQSKSTTSISLG